MTPSTPNPELTQTCVRCGAIVPLGTSMCENCNPLGLKQPAPSQAHGTVFLAIIGAVIFLAVLGRVAIAGIGPFKGAIGNVVAAPPGLAVTLTVTNLGTTSGSSTCRVFDPDVPGIGPEIGVHHQPAHRGRRDHLVLEAGGRPRFGRPAARGGVHRPVTDGRFGPELGLARDLADRAGTLLVERFGRVESIRHKSPKDVVTEVDHLSEELILAAIREGFPDDAILAEESGGSPGRDERNGRVWVIDPLDGTINYANGIPLFCVSIALVVDGRSTVGVVRDPIRGETFAASADGPATLDGRAIQASVKPLLSDYVLSLALDGSATSERLRAIHAAVRVTRRLGSAALALSYAGCGRFDAYAQTDGLNAWDVAAAGLIAERAGATVTRIDRDGPWLDLDGRAGSFGVVAAPPAHHAELLDLVRQPV